MGRRVGNSLFYLPDSRGRHLLPIALRYQEEQSLQQDVAKVPQMNKPYENQFLMVTMFRR